MIPDSEHGTTGAKKWILGFISRWGPAWIWMMVIYLVSAQPQNGGIVPDFGQLDFLLKKTAHLVEYAILAVFLHRGMLEQLRYPEKSSKLRHTWPWAIVLSILYAVTDEYHQTLVSGREGKVQDVFIDSLGATVGALSHHFKTKHE